MLDELSFTYIDRVKLIREYKELHQKYGSVEYPFVTLELPSIKKYSNLSVDELKKLLGEAFHRFNSVRKQRLKLYDGVLDTVKLLFEQGVTIIGYTESAQESGLYRLKSLKFLNISNMYTASHKVNIEMYIQMIKAKSIGVKNPIKIFCFICKERKIVTLPKRFIGDSLTKDVYAKQAGIVSVWANYPKKNRLLRYVS